MDEEELLNEVRRRPDDDAPRLEFADRLDERGDPRGEFIRLQCALARIGADDPVRPALDAHLRSLEPAQIAETLERLRPLGVRDIRMHRGFVERMHVQGTAFLDLWRALAGVAPGLRGLRWTDLPRVGSGHAVQRLLEDNTFSCLTSLSLFATHIDLPAMEALAAAPRTAQLTSLDLGRTLIAGSGIRALARSSHLSGLRALKLSHCDLTGKDVAAVARAPSLNGLETLDLSGNQMGDEGFEAVVTSRRMASLKSLRGDDNQIGPAGIIAFANSSQCLQLASLFLNGNWIGDSSADLMATSSSCGRLVQLSLDRCGITETGRQSLLRSPWLARLTDLRTAER